MAFSHVSRATTGIHRFSTGHIGLNPPPDFIFFSDLRILFTMKHYTARTFSNDTESRHVASLLITGGGRFPQILYLLSGFENWSFQWLSRETSIFKILMIDDVTLWSKLESAWFSRFINSISETDDNQDVSARTVGGKVHGPFSAWGGVIV